jgi:hypothetical protein
LWIKGQTRCAKKAQSDTGTEAQRGGIGTTADGVLLRKATAKEGNLDMVQWEFGGLV